MNPEAIEKAWLRFYRARSALSFISAVMNYDGFVQHWSDFLIAGNGVYLALEKGAKDSPQSRQWFGSKKRERRLDPLLTYLHQARNAEEHGVKPVSAPGAALRGVELFEAHHLIHDTYRTREGIFGYFSTAEKAAVVGQITPPDAELISVHNDKFGQTFDPPTEHLGRPLESRTPLSLGLLWLVHLRRIIREAEKLTTSHSARTL